MDKDEESRRIRQRRLAEAEAKDAEKSSIYDAAMEAAYRRPKKAEQKMQDYEIKHGKDARNKELEDSNSLKFGRRPGSILSADGFKPGAAEKQQNSHLARRALPRIIDGRDKAREELIGAKGSHDALTPKPDGQGDGKALERSGQNPGEGATRSAPKKASDGRSRELEPQQTRAKVPDVAAATAPSRPAPSAAVSKPPRFGEVARDKPVEPVALRSGEKAQPELKSGFRPKALEAGKDAGPKPSSFSDKIRASEPKAAAPGKSSFSDKLAGLQKKPTEKVRGRGRDEEIER